MFLEEPICGLCLVARNLLLGGKVDDRVKGELGDSPPGVRGVDEK